MKNRYLIFGTGLAVGLAFGLALPLGKGLPSTQADSHPSAPPGFRHGADTDWLSEDLADAMKQVEGQLRGMDVTMWEIGYRFTELYHAGQDQNWGYADYQFEKIAHALRFGLERRPARAESAAPFVEEVLPAVEELVSRHEPESFMRGMEQLRAGCMQCHVAEEVPHFTVAFPTHRASSIAPLPEDDPFDW